MSNTNNLDYLESLNKISSTVSERDKKIWENEAHSACIKKATEELKKETERMRKATAEIQKETKMIETRSADDTASITVHKETLRTSEQSILIHKQLKENLSQKRDKMKKKYATMLQMYEDEYQEWRAMYESKSHGYKELREKEIKVKKLKIAAMDLDVKIVNLEKSLRQHEEIQKQILRATIIKLAKFYILYHKNLQTTALLQEKKNEEQQLMKQHFELMKIVKEKQTKKLQERSQSQMMDSLSVKIDNQSSSEHKKIPTKNKDSSEAKLQKFLNEEFKPFSLTSMESLPRAAFNKDESKVRILDMKVVKLPTSQTQTVKKSNLELRKKMEAIIETTQRQALRANSFQATSLGSQHQNNAKKKPVKSTQDSQEKTKTPIKPIENSQEKSKAEPSVKLSQNAQERIKTVSAKLSQNSQEKYQTPKDKSQMNPILKQNKEPSQDETKDEATLKNSAKNKKSVTFESGNRSLKSSQEEKSVGETESKFTFKNDGNVNDDKKKEAISTNEFQFSINKKENIKPVEFKSMEIFRKPLAFSSDAMPKLEKKKCDNFMQTPSFAIFGHSSSETEPSGSISSKTVFTSSNQPFSGPGSEITEDPSSDPFETSIIGSYAHNTLLNTTNDFAPAPEPSTTFNFGSQNKNNPFATF